MTERTIVDDFVKHAMLDHFGIFPTRFAVLEHVFLTLGNGFRWKNDENGHAVPVARYNGKGQEMIPTFEEDNPAFANRETYEPFEPARRANAELQNLIRDWANRNIDVISTSYFRCYGHSLGSTHLYSHCEMSMIATAPDNIHPDWKAALVDFAGDVLVHIRGKHALGSMEDAKIEDWLKANDTALVQPWRVCKAAVNRFRDPARDALASQLIAEVLAEEKTRNEGQTH